MALPIRIAVAAARLGAALTGAPSLATGSAGRHPLDAIAATSAAAPTARTARIDRSVDIAPGCERIGRHLSTLKTRFPAGAAAGELRHAEGSVTSVMGM